MNRAGRLGLAVLLALLAAACEREERDYRPKPPAASLPHTIRLSELEPGLARDDGKAPNPYEASAYDVSQGKKWYSAFNCNGCHFNGGGGIGPPLMDDVWIYGSEPANVVATILEGRPNGMPSFRGKITEAQAWQLAAYVRSMSGLLAKDVSPGRSDHMMAKQPESSTERMTPKAGGSVPPSASSSQ